MLLTTTGFGDIFKDGFLANFTSGSMNVLELLLAMAVSFGLGVFIFFIYKRTFNGVLYSKTFNQSLIMLAMVTTLIIRCITANLALSLGMVGALSIVRFRTAVKDVIDTVYMFWAIAVGIVLAAGLIPLAVFGSIFIGVVLFAFSKKKTVDSPYILVVHCENSGIEEQARIFVKSQVRRLNLKSKSVDNSCVELNYEVRLKEDSSAFVNELEAMPGVSRVVLVSYNGDYMG